MGQRELLVQAATRLIDDTEQWTWSIREICDEAQLPYNAFYRTYRHKHALVDALSAYWKDQLAALPGHGSPREQLRAHLTWLARHRRRIRFLAAEIGVYEGCAVAIDDLAAVLPNRDLTYRLLAAQGLNPEDAQRRMLAALLLLVGYLAGIDAVRSRWAAECGFPSSYGRSPDEGTDAGQELDWLTFNLELLLLQGGAQPAAEPAS